MTSYFHAQSKTLHVKISPDKGAEVAIKVPRSKLKATFCTSTEQQHWYMRTVSKENFKM